MFTGSSSQRCDDQHEQLLELYWNRAEVKRELQDLRRERAELLDKLREREDGALRAREQLEGLERILTIPHAAANAMVYFQLRHLWKVAGQRIERCASDFEAQRRQRELRQLREAELAKRERRLNAIEEKLANIVAKRESIVDDAERLAARLKRWGLVRRWLKGPGLKRQVTRLEKGRRVLDQRIDELNRLMQKIREEDLPELSELSIASRRLVNTAVIALAQHLAVHFSSDDLAGLAKKAMEHAVGSMDFGDRPRCDRMVAVIRERLRILQRQKASELIIKRIERLLPILRYGNETDTVPVVDSVEEVEVIDERSPGSRALAVNVLAENYWSLQGSLR